jgi:uncharacterized membrane protein YsdA (DUF1294 family)
MKWSIPMDYLLIIYAAVNIITWGLYGIDKYKAIKHHYRIPEKTLLLMAAMGPIGGLIGMYLFRHKTRKPVFQFLLPLFLILHIAGILVALKYL